MKHALVIFAFFLLMAQAFAVISSQEAVDFATKTNNFLLTGETAGISPNVKITSAGKAYWVIGVFSGEELSGFIPVSADKAEIPASKELRKNLIETAYFLYNFSRIKSLALQQDQWVFNSLNAKRMADLATKLQSSASLNLTTIETEIKAYPDLLATAEKIKSELNEMAPETGSLSSSLTDTSVFENNFLNNPDTAELAALQEKFSGTFSKIQDLDAKKTDYLLDVTKLNVGIGKTSLSIETKRSLGTLAAAPQEIAYLSSISQSATTLEESISGAFGDALARSQTLADNLDTRIKRNSAYQKLYGQDNEIIEKTGYTSLSSLVEYILSEENAYYWKNTEEVALLRDNWQKSDSYFKNNSFETAQSFAEKSKKNALAVFAGGFEEQKPVVNTDLLITEAVIIIIFLAILIIIRNRRKLSGLISSNESSENNEFR